MDKQLYTITTYYNNTFLENLCENLVPNDYKVITEDDLSMEHFIIYAKPITFTVLKAIWDTHVNRINKLEKCYMKGTQDVV